VGGVGAEIGAGEGMRMAFILPFSTGQEVGVHSSSEGALTTIAVSAHAAAALSQAGKGLGGVGVRGMLTSKETRDTTYGEGGPKGWMVLQRVARAMCVISTLLFHCAEASP
jgi:hypothetical protein